MEVLAVTADTVGSECHMLWTFEEFEFFDGDTSFFKIERWTLDVDMMKWEKVGLMKNGTEEKWGWRARWVLGPKYPDFLMDP